MVLYKYQQYRVYFMGIFLDVELTIEAKNKDKVLSLFLKNNIQHRFNGEVENQDQSDLVSISLDNRNYAEIDQESTLLVENGIQYSAFNHGVYAEVDEQIHHFRIKNGEQSFTSFDLDESKINFTDLQTLINESKNLPELQSLVEHHRYREKHIPWV